MKPDEWITIGKAISRLLVEHQEGPVMTINEMEHAIEYANQVQVAFPVKIGFTANTLGLNVSATLCGQHGTSIYMIGWDELNVAALIMSIDTVVADLTPHLHPDEACVTP